MIDVENLEVEDAVIGIPKEAVYVEINAKILDDGSLVTVTTKLSPSEIREAFKTFTDTINGDYPFYQCTEAGKKWLEELEQKELGN